MELVTDSKFEVTQVVIQGFPKQIPDGHLNRLPNLVVPGPAFQGETEQKNQTHCLVDLTGNIRLMFPSEPKS